MSMEVMQQSNSQVDREGRETMYLLGGVAMVVFGAGLILSTPSIRRYLGGMKFANIIEAAIPDLGRYMKMRAM